MKKLHGFRLESVDDLGEFRAVGNLWIHEKLKTPVYHIQCDDKENLIAFAFKTPPEDSTGVAHILEHSVLCGSKNFPTKDPFLYLYKSSLNTFLNAMTYPDKTLYPVASVVAKDFYNLVNVYADAVYVPLLKPEIFSQEGHRLEWEEGGGLIRSGVVFNEMKGNYSSAESVISDAVMRSVFTSGPYSFDSGGDPAHIPELTYEQFVDFHKKHYHPSQSMVLLYGNLPPDETLKILDRKYFRHFEPTESAPELPRQDRWSQPRVVHSSFPVSETSEADEGTLAITWIVGDCLDHDRVLELDILSEVLLGDAGVLQKTLLESGLGQDLSPVSGLETELRDLVWSVGLRGASSENAKAFESLVVQELQNIAKNGLAPELVESVVQSYEFSVREIRGGGMGLRFMRRLLRGWLHGASPKDTLAFQSRMDSFKKRIRSGERVLENLIQSVLLENSHRALVIASPDAQLLARDEEAAQEVLATLRMNATADELEILKAQQRNLKAFQESPDRPADVAKLPVLKLGDIPRKVERISNVWEEWGGIKTSVYEKFTNGVLYFDLGFDLAFLTEEDWLVLPLLTRVIDSLGLENLSWDVLAREIALKTGGIGFRFSTDASIATGGGSVSKFWIRVKMLENKIEDALKILSDILLHADWNNRARLKDLLLELKNDVASSLVPRGHTFAATRSARSFSVTGTVNELTSGLAQLDYLNALASTVEAKGALESLLGTLSNLVRRIFRSQGTYASVVGKSSAMNELRSRLPAFLSALDSHASKLEPAADISVPSSPRRSIRTIASTVGYTAHTLRATKLTDSGHAAQLVLSHKLKTGYLWEEIRMKGGAYGAFSSTNGLEGLFTFATYRDPGLISSLEAFRASLVDAQKNLLSSSELSNTIIGTVSSDLSPRSPSEEGALALQRSLLGITDEMRQKKRDSMLGLKPKNLAKAASELEALFDSGISVTLTSSVVAQEAMKDSRWGFVLESEDRPAQ